MTNLETSSAAPGDDPSVDMGDDGTLVVEDQSFAIVGEWVITSELSDAAFRVYSMLLRYGGTSGHRSRPGHCSDGGCTAPSAPSTGPCASSSPAGSCGSSTATTAASTARTGTTCGPPTRSAPRNPQAPEGVAAHLRPPRIPVTGAAAPMRLPLAADPRPGWPQICGPTQRFLPREHLLSRPPPS